MNCLSCTAPTTNGLALCETCRVAGSTYLEFLPVYFRNLARWRPGRAGSRPVPGSREPQGVGQSRGDRVTDALDEAGTDIAHWARCLADDRDVELPQQDEEAVTVAALCRLLNEHMTTIATLEWAGEFVTSLSHHERRLRALTEDVIPGWYAGECRVCASPTFVVPGLTWVTCGACGVTTYARDHLETILEEARGWVARPMRLAEAAVALLDTEMSVPRLYERIKKWGARNKIDVLRENEYALKRYRFGEVLDRLADEGETTLRDTDAAKSA